MASQFAREAIEIKTPRVVIRTGLPSDAEAFARYNRTPANFSHGGCQPDATTDKAAGTIAKFTQWAAEGKHAWVFMFARETGEFMGYGGYNCFASVNAASFLAGPSSSTDSETKDDVLADMGIMLDHRFWGAGYGLEIFIGLVAWAQREMGARVFRTETDVENEEWQALMRRAQLGECVSTEAASYDAAKKVLQWRWNDETWQQAKKKLQEQGRWIDID